MTLLDDVLGRLGALPPDEQESVVQMAMEATQDMPWVPNPGPQTDAFFCDADELFYGGEAGGGKSALECGLAVTAHQRSLLLRRTNKEAEGLVEEITAILGSREGFNGQSNVWRLPGRTIDIGGCQLEDDKQKYKGKPHDLICFDEVSDFTETQYTFIIGWNRSANPAQRCRVVAAGNPPTRPEGFWVIKRWAAWLDPRHPNPAADGELRWYTTGEDGDEVEVDGPGPHMIKGELITARSRTFIRAKLSDNPDLAATNYSAVLAGLPPALRAAYRDGRFDLNTDDDHWQAIPTSWVRAAQARWTERAPVGVPQCAIGCDVAQGGADQTVLAIRHDGWYAPLHVIPGALTPLGSDVAGAILAKRRDNSHVIIDVGGGWGADAFGHLRANEIEAFAYMGVKESVNRTLEGNLRFKNVRTEAYWRFREALNPDQPGGSPIMLPPDDRELLADLTAPRYETVNGQGGIKLESKEELVKRIGRSPDRGDAVVMSWFSGPKAITDFKQWQKDQVAQRRTSSPRVVMGHANRRR